VLYHADGAFTAGALAGGWLDRAGWVFLGSPSDGRWVFDLAFGGGGPDPEPFAEGFQLTRSAMWVVSDAEAPVPLGPDVERLVQRIGLHTGAFSEPQFARVPHEPERGRSSSLHLFGSADRPSPTVVLGRVFRRSLLASWLGTRAHDRVVPLPYGNAPPAADWPGGQPPPELVRAYGHYMSRAVVEPYARSADFIEKNLAAPQAADAFDPPYALVGLEKLTRQLEPLDPDPGKRRTFLYAADDNARAKLYAADRRAVFAGELGDLAPVDLLLPERTTHVFRTSDLRRWTAGGKLRVRGILALDPAEPDLVLDRPLEVEEGGVIVVRGSIDIDAPIVAAPGCRAPLTLVALEGRIRVKAPRVHAFLVALGETGMVERTGDGDLELRGGVAASRLDVASLSRGVASPPRIAKTLTHDARDAAPAFYMDARRVVVLR